MIEIRITHTIGYPGSIWLEAEDDAEDKFLVEMIHEDLMAWLEECHIQVRRIGMPEESGLTYWKYCGRCETAYPMAESHSKAKCILPEWKKSNPPWVPTAWRQLRQEEL